MPFRSLAVTSSIAWVAFYFLLINMLQRLNLDYLDAALNAAKAATESGAHLAKSAAGAGVWA